MKPLLRTSALTLLGIVALSGCLRFTADLEVHGDDTVDGRYVVAVEEGAGETVGVADRELAEDLYGDSELSGTLVDPHQHAYRRDGYVGTRIDFRDQPLSAFAPTSDRFGIVRQGDEFIVTGPASAAAADDADFGDAEIWVSITFPGDVVEANGVVDGRTVTWNLVGGPDDLYARASATTGPPPASAFVATAVVIMAVAALLYFRVGSSSRSGAAPSRTTSQPRPAAPQRSGSRAPAPRATAPSRQAPRPPQGGAPTRRPTTPQRPHQPARPTAPPRRG